MATRGVSLAEMEAVQMVVVVVMEGEMVRPQSPEDREEGLEHFLVFWGLEVMELPLIAEVEVEEEEATLEEEEVET